MYFEKKHDIVKNYLKKRSLYFQLCFIFAIIATGWVVKLKFPKNI